MKYGLLFCALTLSLFLASPAHAQSILVPGDMNADNDVDLFDTVAVINVVLGRTALVNEADINQDTDVDIRDVVLCANLAVGNPAVAHSDPLIIPNAAGQVTIRGGNFDPVPANNVIVINGVTEPVQSVVTINGRVVGLVVSVQGGTTTGGVMVTSGGATALNNPPLTVGGAVFSINDVTVDEGDGTATLTLDSGFGQAGPPTSFRVTVSTMDGSALSTGAGIGGSDFTAINNQPVTFTAGGRSTAQVTIVINDDMINEGTELFSLVLSNPEVDTGGGFVTDTNSTILDSSGTVTITDNDDSNISIDDVAVAEGDTGTTTLDFTISVDNASTSDIRVMASTMDGSATTANNDYAMKSETVTIAAGQTSASFAVVVNGDANSEPDETLTVNLTSPAGGLGGQPTTMIVDNQGVGGITNDDLQGADYTINDVTINENAGTATLTIDSGFGAGGPSRDFRITVNTMDDTALSTGAGVGGSDFTTINNQQVTFTQGGSSTAQVTIIVNDDMINEENEQFNIDLSNPAVDLGAGFIKDSSSTITDGTGVVTITDNDDSNISIDSVSVAEGNTASFTVTIDKMSSSDITVTASTADGTATTADSDYVANSATLTITAGSFNTTFSVVTQTDVVSERDESFFVNLSNPIGSMTTSISVAQGQGTIQGDILVFDFNADGFVDTITSATRADPNGRANAGAAYIIYGSATPPASLDLANLTQAQGLIIQGAASNHRMGTGVTSFGDFNNDGISDIIVGALGADPLGRAAAGAAYIIYGSATPPAVIDLANLTQGQGLIIQGAVAGDQFGRSDSSFGDFNNDGMSDVLIGAPFADPNGRDSAGVAYVIYGSATPPASLDLLNLTQAQGLVIQGAAATDQFGFGLGVSFGDFNNDGLSDILTGARFSAPNGRANAGAAYVIYGSATPPAIIDLANLTQAQGLIIQGAVAEDRSATSLSLGDFNNDGIADAIVGALRADPLARSTAGIAYVIYGSTTPSAVIDLANLTQAQGLIIQGAVAGDQVGMSLSFGDFNNDGLSDILAEARFSDPNGRANAGAAYVIYGSATPPAILDLANLTQAQGLIIQGAVAGDQFGRSVSSFGDFNNDGIADILVAAFLADPNGRTNAGAAYLVYGSTNPPAVLDLANLTQAQGLIIEGAAADDRLGDNIK